MSVDPRKFEYAILGKLSRRYPGGGDVIQIGFKQFACGLHLSFLHERDYLYQRSAATALYLDPNVEKTFVVVRIMPLIRHVRGATVSWRFQRNYPSDSIV